MILIDPKTKRTTFTEGVPRKIKKKMKLTKRQELGKSRGEVFTPAWLVSEMLDKLPDEVWQEGKTYLDNSCGTGNFLVEVLARKLALGHDPLGALQTIYGADITLDNIQAARRRMLEIVSSKCELTAEHCRAVLVNIKWLDLKKFPKGSLSYDFGFEDKPPKKQVEALLSKMVSLANT
jgi:hypothetical protein